MIEICGPGGQCEAHRDGAAREEKCIGMCDVDECRETATWDVDEAPVSLPVAPGEAPARLCTQHLHELVTLAHSLGR